MNNRRRKFLKLAGAAASLPLFTPLLRAAELLPKNAPRVVVVGGGCAGAIAAKTLRMANPELEVVLVERNRSYSALPGANWIIGGSRRIGENRLSYDRLESTYGIKMIYEEASTLDVGDKRVILPSGTLAYDYAIVAPGIAFRTDDIDGYGANTAELFPHAWTSGEEVAGLKRRLEEMKDGGLVIVSLPATPYRCPQAAYERISQMASYLKQVKPRSKIIVLDANPAIASLGDLFTSGWNRLYKNMIDYRSGQSVLKVDPGKGRLTSNGESFHADLVNLIPPQMAGTLAHKAGLVDSDKRWCPVDHTTHHSTLANGVYVIGDACLADGLQKSAAAANAQGKACALNIAAVSSQRAPQTPVYANTIYSLLNDQEGAASVSFYRGEGRRPAPISKGGGNSGQWSELEATYARAWLGSLLTETFS